MAKCKYFEAMKCVKETVPSDCKNCEYDGVYKKWGGPISPKLVMG